MLPQLPREETKLTYCTLIQSADEIKFIRSPQEGEMGIEMLLLLAKEEAEEMPQRA